MQQHAACAACQRGKRATSRAEAGIDMTSDHQAAIDVDRTVCCLHERVWFPASHQAAAAASTAAGQRSPSVLDTRNWTPTTTLHISRCIASEFLHEVDANTRAFRLALRFATLDWMIDQ